LWTDAANNQVAMVGKSLRGGRFRPTFASNVVGASPMLEPVKAAHRAPEGLGLDGDRFFTLGHAVQDDSAACTAC